MDISDKNLNKLRKLFDLMDEDALTKAEFVKSFKSVIKLVLKSEKTLTDKTDRAVSDLKGLFSDLERKLESTTNTELSRVIKELKGFANKASKEQQVGMNLVRDKLRGLRDGKDADAEKIIDEVLKKIPEQKPIELDAEKLRDKLEELVGDERIDISAIRGGESLKGEKAKAGMVSWGGGMSKIAMDRHILDPYTPTKVSSTEYTLTKAPNPAASLKVWRGGALKSLTEDYTISGTTLTFLIAIVDGEVIKVEHRI